MIRMPPTFDESDRPDPELARGDRAILPITELEIRVCQHTTCRKDGSAKVLQAFEAYQLPGIGVVPAGCIGHCGNGPMVTVLPAQISYSQVRSRDVAAIIAQHAPSERSLIRQSELGRSSNWQGGARHLRSPQQENFEGSGQTSPSVAVFWPYVALGLALLIALGSILGTVLSLG